MWEQSSYSPHTKQILSKHYLLAYRRTILHASHLPSDWETGTPGTTEGPGVKLVGLDSALAPVGKTLALGAQHTTKPISNTQDNEDASWTQSTCKMEAHIWRGRIWGWGRHNIVGPCHHWRDLLWNHWFLQRAEKDEGDTSGEISVALPHLFKNTSCVYRKI